MKSKQGDDTDGTCVRIWYTTNYLPHKNILHWARQNHNFLSISTGTFRVEQTKLKLQIAVPLLHSHQSFDFKPFFKSFKSGGVVIN